MKRLFKRTIGFLMRIATLPVFIFYLLEKTSLGERKSFSGIMQAFSLIPGAPGEWLRRAILQWITGQPLEDCCISFGTTFSDPRVRIGNGVYIGTRCEIGYAEIGADCVIGSGVHVLSGKRQHAFDDVDTPIRDQETIFEVVRLGEDCWIANGCIVANDVGKKCVIGAGSVVVDPVPSYGVAMGNPCRVRRTRQSGA